MRIRSACYLLLIIGVSIVMGAGIWGQIIVGSDKLLRPFGYYGGILGAATGILLVRLLLDQEIFSVAAALCVAAPSSPM